MKKWITTEAERLGIKPATVAGEVEDINLINKPGVYAVKGYTSPVCAERVTDYGGDELAEQGYDVRNGFVFIETGKFVDEECQDKDVRLMDERDLSL